MATYKGWNYYYKSRVNGVWSDWNSLHGFFAPTLGQVPTMRMAISVIKDRFYDDVDKIQLGIGKSLDSILVTHTVEKSGYSYAMPNIDYEQLRNAFYDLHDLI